MSDEYMEKNGDMIREIAKEQGLDAPEKKEAEKPKDEQMSMKEKVNELVGKLEQGLKEIFESGKYQDYLNTMAKFHNYSVNNTLLINQQKPEATLVAGYDSWAKNFDRHVKRGEKGIKIIAPAPYMVKKEMPLVDPKTGEHIFNADGTPKMTEVDVKIPAFKISYVYDISQTYGKELPSLGVSELGESVDRVKDFIQSLKNVSPVPIEFGETRGESKGFYSPTDQSITIKEGMSDAQTIKTMVHEISHAKLHNPQALKENETPKSQGTIEMEAESVAYIVCQHFGIDTSDYSFGYIAGWSEGKGPEELKASMNSIRDTAGEMINRVEGSLRALEHDRQKEIEEAKVEVAEVSAPGKVTTPTQNQEEEFANKVPIEKEVTKTVVEVAKETVQKEQSKTKEEKSEKSEKPKQERKSLKAKLAEKRHEVAKEKKDKTLNKENEKVKGGAR